jgi:hypothetical protein
VIVSTSDLRRNQLIIVVKRGCKQGRERSDLINGDNSWQTSPFRVTSRQFFVIKRLNTLPIVHLTLDGLAKPIFSTNHSSTNGNTNLTQTF